MPKPRKEEYVFYEGEKFHVEFYYTEKGEMPAKEYMDGSSIDVQAKLAALVKRLADYGKLYDKTKFRQVDKNNKIYEFKPVGHRFFSFFCKGRKIIITNAYMKKSQKVSKNDLEKSKSLKKQYISRVKGGSYYEKE